MATLRSSTGPDCVQVPGTVNGKAVPLVVDSGANRTLVRADVLGDSTRDILPEIPNGLADVTGRRTALHGPTEVTLCIDGMCVKQVCFVADHLSDPVILGLDFLKQNQCVLDFMSGVMQMNGRQVPLCDGGGDGSPKVFRVRVMSPVTVEPGVERMIRCKPAGPRSDRLGLLEAGPLCRSGLLVGRTIVDPRERCIPVLVANLTDKPIRVRAGTAVGVCEEVELLEMPLWERSQIFKTRNCPHISTICSMCVAVSCCRTSPIVWRNF